jgi:predicted DNA-binding transcriptional regulator YafY
VPEPAKDYRASFEALDEIVTAIVYNTPLDARYRTIAGLESTKLLHPYTLATFRQALYLFALDVESGQIKTYAVERFSEVLRRRGEHFAVPVGWRPEAHIANAFGIISGPPEHVVIAFHERVEAYIRERTWHATQSFVTRRDGRLELHMDVAVTVELQTWIQAFGSDAEVIAPPQLRTTIATALRAALDRYEK